MDAGPLPPAPPRKLPKGFELRIRLTRNVPLIIGMGFTLVGALMTVSFFLAKPWIAVFPGFMLLAGLLMAWNGIVQGARTIDAFRNGEAVKGKIASVRQDMQTKINNRHPWNVVYSFQDGDYTYEGKTMTMEAETANRFYGAPPVWVLVVKGQPERSALYPPVK